MHCIWRFEFIEGCHSHVVVQRSVSSFLRPAQMASKLYGDFSDGLRFSRAEFDVYFATRDTLLWLHLQLANPLLIRGCMLKPDVSHAG